MQKYNGQLIRQFASSVTGNAASGVTVTVRKQSDNSLATLYVENNIAGATLSNPLTTGSTGHFAFYAADGVYTLAFSDNTPQQVIQLQDTVELQEQFDNAVANAGYIPSGMFAAGATLTQANQVLSDGSSYWRWDGSFPKTVTAGSAPTPTGVGGWFVVSDFAVRQDLSDGKINGIGFVTPEMHGGSIQAAITAAGVNGVISLKPKQTYVVDREITMLDGQTLIGNKAVIKRVNQVVTTTTTAITAGVTTSVTLTSATGFSIGQEVAFAQNGVARGSLVFGVSLSVKRTITNIVGNIITLNAAPDINLTSGSTCFLAFVSVEMAEDCEVSGLRFDGNKANWSYNRWEVICELSTLSGKNGQLIENNLFINSPSECIIPFGDDCLISNNKFKDSNGNAVHLSGVQNCIISKNIGKNGNIDSAVGHQDGFVSVSNENLQIIISDNIARQYISGVGAINGTDDDFTVSGNDFYDMYCFGIEGGSDVANVTITGNRIKNVPTNTAARPGSPNYGGIVLTALTSGKYTIVNNIVSGVVGTNRGLAISGTTGNAANGFTVNNNQFDGTSIVSNISDYEMASNKFNGQLTIGTSVRGDIHHNRVSVAAGVVAVQLNASNTYEDISICDNKIQGGIFGLSLTSNATLYKGISVKRNKFYNQTNRGFNFETFANTLSGMWIEDNEFFTGPDALTSYIGCVMYANDVTVARNKCINDGAAGTRIGITAAVGGTKTNVLIYDNEVRGDWSHTILLTASTGVYASRNLLKTKDVSNPTGNFVTGSVVF